jgi:hypothetical protein
MPRLSSCLAFFRSANDYSELSETSSTTSQPDPSTVDKAPEISVANTTISVRVYSSEKDYRQYRRYFGYVSPACYEDSSLPGLHHHIRQNYTAKLDHYSSKLTEKISADIAILIVSPQSALCDFLGNPEVEETLLRKWSLQKQHKVIILLDAKGSLSEKLQSYAERLGNNQNATLYHVKTREDAEHVIDEATEFAVRQKLLASNETPRGRP